MKRLILSLVLVLIGHTALADQCNTVGISCLEYDTITVSGVVIEDACVRVQKAQDCVKDDRASSCEGLAALALRSSYPLEDEQCRLTDETCLSYRKAQFALGMH